MPIFVHDFEGCVPEFVADWYAAQNIYDETLLKRIANAFIDSGSEATGSNADLWTINVSNHQEFVHFLRSGQYENADLLLRNMFATPLTHGFQQGESVAQALKTSAHSRDHVLTNYVDKLIALASYLRVIPIQNPEQGEYLRYLKTSPDFLLDGIEEKIGVALKAPPFQGGLWGLKTSRGYFSDRDFLALFVALKIRDLAAGSDAKICEIGGGAGYLAYYCNLLGYQDFTIIDLPTVRAVQAYFISQNLGSDKVFLAGEPGTANAVKILSPSDFHTVPVRWDIVVNVDSLPEMATAIMESYLDRIGKLGSIFLSINQEALNQRTSMPGDVQERVGDIIDKLGAMHRIYRCPFWMRRGYAEELYAPQMALSGVPVNFDPAAYLKANPDVAAAGVDAAQHYINYGRHEGRSIK